MHVDCRSDIILQCFIHNALNHSNKVCRLLLLAKLHSISSTFATNYRHLCYKYELVQSDWHSGLAHLLGKVKMKYQNKNSQNCPANMSIIRELWDIRDGRHIAGASPGFGRGGPRNFFFSDLGICMSRSDMLRMAKPCALLGGFGGMLPRKIFLKRCNLVRFRVYFDQILSLFFSKNAIFYIKNK